MYNPFDGFTNKMELEGPFAFFICRNFLQFEDLARQFNADPNDERYALVTAQTPTGYLAPGMFPVGTTWVSLVGGPTWAVDFCRKNFGASVLPYQAFTYVNHEYVPAAYDPTKANRFLP